jgi:hypothetical protein
MAFGTILRPRVTLGELSILSRYFLALLDFGFDASAFGVMLGAVVDFAVDEGEELGEVGGGPTFDALKKGMNSRHFFIQFTFCSR